jgi:iron complex outermembrane receptor protein
VLGKNRTILFWPGIVLAVAAASAQAQEADENASQDPLDALMAPAPASESEPAREPSPEPESEPPPGAGAKSDSKPEPSAYAEVVPVTQREAAPAAPQPPRSRRAIEEIVVSARKREESLQDAPVVVSALSKAQLERYNAGDMTKIAEMTPQLFVSRGSNGNGGTINLRGIGSSATTSGFDQAVAINVDGIQYSRANVLHQGYFDVGQVEVLKGPQSLFFGKSSSAGVISLTTANPGPDREAVLKLGNEFEASERFIEGVLSGPLSDSFGARLAARYSSTGHYIDNLATATTDPADGSTVPAPEHDWPQEEQSMARLTLSYLGDGPFNASLKLFWVDMENVGQTQSAELALCEATGSSTVSPGQECRGDWRVAQNPVSPQVAATESHWNYRGGEMYAYYRSYSAVLNAGYEFDAFSLTSVTGYYEFDNEYLGDYDYSATPATFATENPAESAMSQELRLLTSFDGALNAMIGGYYQHKQFDFKPQIVRIVPVPADPATGRYTTWDKVSETTGDAWSVFGQLIWQATDTLEVNAGARYSDEVKDSFSVHNYVHPVAGTALGLKPAGERLEARTHDTNISPELTVSWNPGTFLLYGAYKKGFKSGGYSNSAILARVTTADDATFAPETVSGFELGYKSRLFDDSLQVNVAAYNYEFKDLQVNFFDSANINFITQNAASATTRGVELDFVWLTPIDGLDIHGAASYNRARYGDFISFCYGGQSQEDGCNLRDDQGRPVQDLGGSVRPIAPEYTFNLGLFYERPLFGTLMVSFSADASYVDRYLLSSLGRQFYQDAYLRPDASIGVGRADGRWKLSLVGRNLTNEYIAYDSGDSPLSGAGTGQPEASTLPADQLAIVGRPREIAVQFSLHFGD